jgi:hypothetical protein
MLPGFKDRAMRHILVESSLLLRFLWAFKEAVAQGLPLEQDEQALLIEKGLVLSMTRQQPLALMALALTKEVVQRSIPGECHYRLTRGMQWLLEEARI